MDPWSPPHKRARIVAFGRRRRVVRRSRTTEIRVILSNGDETFTFQQFPRKVSFRETKCPPWGLGPHGLAYRCQRPRVTALGRRYARFRSPIIALLKKQISYFFYFFIFLKCFYFFYFFYFL